MSAAYLWPGESLASTPIANWFRQYRDTELRGAYLVMLNVGPDEIGNHCAYPQTRAVVDDFGNLCGVRGWQ